MKKYLQEKKEKIKKYFRKEAVQIGVFLAIGWTFIISFIIFIKIILK